MADPVSPFTPTMQQQLEQLLGLQTDRSARTAPIHQAAMAMAQHMAPGYAQGAMSAPSSLPRPTGSSVPSSSSSGGIGPGIGTTATAALFMALLKNPGFLSAVTKLFPGDPTFGGLIQGDKPLTGGTGFPSVPFGGSGGGGDPTQPGGAQGQGFGIGLPFSSAWGGSGSVPTGPGGNQADYSDDPTRKSP